VASRILQKDKEILSSTHNHTLRSRCSLIISPPALISSSLKLALMESLSVPKPGVDLSSGRSILFGSGRSHSNCSAPRSRLLKLLFRSSLVLTNLARSNSALLPALLCLLVLGCSLPVRLDPPVAFWVPSTQSFTRSWPRAFTLVCAGSLPISLLLRMEFYMLLRDFSHTSRPQLTNSSVAARAPGWRLGLAS